MVGLELIKEPKPFLGKRHRGPLFSGELSNWRQDLASIAQLGLNKRRHFGDRRKFEDSSERDIKLKSIA